jgi:purine-binding chemotaxis protein CheW
MDIAKIRKKAKEQEAEKRQGERSVPPASGVEGLPATLPKTEENPQIQEQSVSEVAEPAGPGLKEAPEPLESPAGVQEGVEEEQLELLTFRLLNEEFAFRVPEVEEIIRYQKVTKVPTMPDYMLGITSLRGKIIPVIDLKARLNLKRLEHGAEQHAEEEASSEKILIIEGPKGFIGAAVDRVVGVVRILKGDVLDPPAHLTEAELGFLSGVVVFDKRFISIVSSENTMNIEIG